MSCFAGYVTVTVIRQDIFQVFNKINNIAMNIDSVNEVNNVTKA